MEELTKTYFFRDLDQAELKALTEVTKIQEVRKGETVLKQRDLSDQLYIVRTGSVRVLLPTSEGLEVDDISEQTLIVLGPGECFGEFAFVDRQPASASVVAAEDGTVYAISHGDIERVLLGTPETAIKFYKALLHVLVSRIRNTDIELAVRKAFSG